jgi:hypothetical protein
LALAPQHLEPLVEVLFLVVPDVEVPLTVLGAMELAAVAVVAVVVERPSEARQVALVALVSSASGSTANESRNHQRQ